VTAAAIPERKTAGYRLSIGFVCLVLAGLAGFTVVRGGWHLTPILVIALVGILRGVRWGRRLGLFVFWMVLLSGLVMVMPPEKVDGYTPEMVPIGTAIVRAAVLALLGLTCLHLLGRYRRSFRAEWF